MPCLNTYRIKTRSETSVASSLKEYKKRVPEISTVFCSESRFSLLTANFLTQLTHPTALNMEFSISLAKTKAEKTSLILADE